MSQILEFAGAVLKNLPEPSKETMQWWIENPQNLQALLAGLSKIPAPKPEVWKTIQLGTGLATASSFRQSINEAGAKVSDWAYDMMSKPEFKVASSPLEVDLVRVSGFDLGFKKSVARAKIYERAQELGLELCPPEVGPQLRRQYLNQPNREWLLVGMEAIRFSDGYLLLFCVGCFGSGLWLNSYCDDPDDVWNPDNYWLFVRPRKCQKQNLDS